MIVYLNHSVTTNRNDVVFSANLEMVMWLENLGLPKISLFFPIMDVNMTFGEVA